jgi:hypothetical protein
VLGRLIKTSRAWSQLIGIFLLLIGGCICYNSLVAAIGYINTGQIAWGSVSRHTYATGGMALAMHLFYAGCGCWLAAKGLVMTVTGQEPAA